jgi:hypothetical protein
MHITIAHKKTVEQAMQEVDRSMDQVFEGLPIAPIQIVETGKRWTGQAMEFGFKTKLGLLTYPINGRVEVTNCHFAVDIELGLFAKCLPQGRTQEIETRLRGLIA